MIDVLSSREISLNPSLLDAMYRLRYRVFRERMGWDIPVRDGRDHDSFDELDPYYLLAFDDSGRLVGCWRMLPSTGSFMLRDVFTQLLEGRHPPCDPGVWEGSRFAVECAYSGRRGLGALHHYTAEVFCAVVEFSLAFGIREVWTVYDARVARLLKRMAIQSLWVSGKHRIGNTTAMAGRFRSDEAMLASIRGATGIRGSVIRHAPWTKTEEAA